MALNAFRNFGDSRVAKGMLLILVLCFGAWGIGDYLVKQVGNDAVTVNGEGLSVSEVERLYQGRIEQVERLMGGRVAPETLTKLNVPATVLQEAISRAVLRQAAAKLGLTPAAGAVRDEIVASPEFSSGGQFDPRRYQDTVARAGLTTAAFEKSVGQDLSVRMLGELAHVVRPEAAVVQPLAALEGAITTLNVVKLTPALLPNMEPLDDKALADFLHDNQAVFAVPETRTLRLLVVDPASVAATMTLSGEDVRAAYDANPAAFAVPEKRKVRHVLVATQEEAEAVAKEAKTATDVARIARERTLDEASKANDGDLGMITREEVVPSFGDAAFDLEKSAVSGPVESPFGWHVLAVEQIEPARTLAFDEVKDQIEATLKSQEAEQAVYDLQNTVDDRIAGGDKLDEIAGDLGLKTTRLVKVAANEEVGVPALLTAGFNTEAGEVSLPVELEGGGVGYVAVEEVIPASVPLLGDIKDKVRKIAEAARQQKTMDSLAVSVLDKVKDGGADWPQKTVGLLGGGETSRLTVTSLKDVPNWLEPGWARLSSLVPGATLPHVLDDGRARYLVQVAERVLATPDEAALKLAAGAARQRWQQDYETLLIAGLIRTADIDTNDARLRQIFGTAKR